MCLVFVTHLASQEIEPAATTGSANAATPSNVIRSSSSQVATTPTNPEKSSKAENLRVEFEQEALLLVNERLRREIELISRAYRESESKNDIIMLAVGGLIAIVFFTIGMVLGRRSGGRRLS